VTVKLNSLRANFTHNYSREAYSCPLSTVVCAEARPITLRQLDLLGLLLPNGVNEPF
jgi:hypothetical protein